MKKSFRPVSVLLALLFAFSSVFTLPIAAAQQFNTNLQNGAALSGSWTVSDVLTGQGNGDSFYMSQSNQSDLLYSADIDITNGAAAAMLFRSSADASHAYVVNFDLNQQNVRLFKFPYTDASCTLGAYSTSLSRNTTYNLAVRAVGSDITVYFNHQKVIEVTDTSYASGCAGLNVFSGTATFQNVYINSGVMRGVEPVSCDTYIGAQPQLPSTVTVDFDNDIHLPFGVTWDAVPTTELAQNGSFDVSGAVDGSSLKATATVTVKPFSTNLTGCAAVSGSWTVGGTLQGTGSGDNFYMSSNRYADLFYSADISMSSGGAASLVFRSNANASQCYVANYDLNQQRVRLFRFPYTGTSCDLGAYPTTLAANTTYHLAVRAVGTHLCIFWNHRKVIDATDSAYASGLVGAGIWSSTASFQNLYACDGTVQSADAAAVTTYVGVAPQFPQTVTAHFANDVTEQLAASWDSVDSARYAKAGSFTVNGALEDTGVKAQADVTVRGFAGNLLNTDAVSGSWTMGDVLEGTGSGDNFLMAANTFSDLLYSADVTIKDGTAAALVFRSDANASHSYVVNYDLNQQNVRLFRFPYTDQSCTLGVYNTSLSAGKTYNLAVRAVGSHFMVYWNHDKVIDVTDQTYASGRVGLNVYSSTADFQNVYCNAGALQSIDPVSLTAYTGVKASLPSSVRAEFANGLYENASVQWDGVDDAEWQQAGTFTVNGTVPDVGGTAEATVQVRSLAGRTVQGVAAVEDRSVTYPTAAGALGLPEALDVTLDDGTVVSMNVTWDLSAYKDADGAYTLTGTLNLPAGVTNPGNFGASAKVTVSGQSTYYTETYRPQYHFTPASMWMNDPNGLIFYNGTYHLFYQYNPNATVWGPMNWGHAESTDLMHWTHLPIALTPDAIGTMFSGSAVADANDTSGFFHGGSGLVAVFSYSTQQVGIAYSSDNGLTWTKYGGNPVIPNPGVSDFRDPKVFWYAPTNKWVMVVAGGALHIYSSPNLKDWTLESSDTGINTECPDLYELPVDGNSANPKWVLSLAGRSYYIGSFDGHKFTAQSPLYTMNYGADCYASQTYNDTAGRRIMLSWMNNGSYSAQLASNAWNGTMTVPYEMTLKTAPDGTVRLYQNPVDEVASVRHDTVTYTDTTIAPGTNLLQNLRGRALDITAKLQTDGASDFSFKVLGTASTAAAVHYSGKTQTLTLDRSGLPNLGISAMKNSQSCTLVPMNGVLTLRILVDNSTIEVFGDDGQAVLTDLAFPDAAGDRLALTTQAEPLTVKSLTISQMSSTWRDDAAQTKLTLDKSALSLGVGGTQSLTAAVTPSVSADSTVTWKAQDGTVASVAVTGWDTVSVTGKRAGTTTVTASTFDGEVVAQAVVTVSGGDSSQPVSSVASGGDSSQPSGGASDVGSSAAGGGNTAKESSAAGGSSSPTSSGTGAPKENNVNTGGNDGRVPLTVLFGTGVLLPAAAFARWRLRGRKVS